MFITDSVQFSEHCKSFHIKYSAGLEHIDILLSDGSKLCLVESKEKIRILSELDIKPHSLTVFVLEDLYDDKDFKETLTYISHRFFSIIKIKSFAQFGEIVGKSALQTACSKAWKGNTAQTLSTCAMITKSVQTIPGLGPKQAQKLVAKYGSLYNLTNTTLGELESLLGQLTAMSVYQFLH